MDDDIVRLADLKHQNFRDNLNQEIKDKELNLIERLAHQGLLQSSHAVMTLLDLHFEKIKKLCQNRIEIERELMLSKYGYLPLSEVEYLKRTARGILAREVQMLSEHPRLQSEYVRNTALEQIPQREASLANKIDRDIEIEIREDKVRLVKAARERFSPEHVNSLMELFPMRDKLNLLFKKRFGFELLKLEHERVLPEIATPCQNENDFVAKVLVLSNLIDWMDTKAMKGRLSPSPEAAKSIGVLEQFLSQNIGAFDPMIIQNLRDIHKLRNNKFPIHKEGEEVIKIFDRLGVKYPPDNWDLVWGKVVSLYIDSIKGLIDLLKQEDDSV